MPIFLKEGELFYFSYIPKCGGMSIENMLKKHANIALRSPYLHGVTQQKFPCSPQHFHLDIVDKIFPMSNFSYKFAVVRHPLHRFISEYKFLMTMRIKKIGYNSF
ncbi:sulfotransferase family 2 domain-containing protein [Halomonas sp. CH40]